MTRHFAEFIATQTSPGLVIIPQHLPIALLYPGADACFAGPVVSIRLKNIREGMEDYEYMQMLADRGDRAFVDEVVQSVARSWTDWEKDPAKVLAARARLAERIAERSGKP